MGEMSFSVRGSIVESVFCFPIVLLEAIVVERPRRLMKNESFSGGASIVESRFCAYRATRSK